MTGALDFIPLLVYYLLENDKPHPALTNEAGLSVGWTLRHV